MKNHDEFRRTVFEKARLYETKRKARSKKIIETASLCSLCLVISISAYLGLGNYDFKSDMLEEDAILTQDKPLDMTSSESNTAEAPAAETTGTYDMTTETAASMTTGSPSFTTTAAETTIAEPLATSSEIVMTTTEEASVETFEPTPTASATTEIPESTSFSPSSPSKNAHLIKTYTCGEGTFQESAIPYSLLVIEDHAAWEEALQTQYSECFYNERRDDLKAEFSEYFFEDNVLIVIHVPNGYEWIAEEEDGNFVYRATGKTDSDMVGYELRLYYMPKGDFRSATIISLSNE